MKDLNATHNPELRSWVESANTAQSDFPIQNLPFAIFKRKDGHKPSGTRERFRAGVAIGDYIVDFKAAHKAGVFSDNLTPMLKMLYKPELNSFMALGQNAWSTLRSELSLALFRSQQLPMMRATFSMGSCQKVTFEIA